MPLYSISVDAIALGAGVAKSIVELATAASRGAKIIEWSVTFDGVSASAVPVKVEVGRFSAAVTTATTFTLDKVDDPGGPVALTTAKHTTTSEGAGTADDVVIYRVPPTGGLVIQYPLGREWKLLISTFWRIRCTAAAVVNVTFNLTLEE